MIGQTVAIGLIFNRPVIGRNVVSRGRINIGSRGWIDTGSIRGEVAAEVVVAIIAAVV